MCHPNSRLGNHHDNLPQWERDRFKSVSGASGCLTLLRIINSGAERARSRSILGQFEELQHDWETVTRYRYISLHHRYIYIGTFLVHQKPPVTDVHVCQQPVTRATRRNKRNRTFTILNDDAGPAPRRKVSNVLSSISSSRRERVLTGGKQS